MVINQGCFICSIYSEKSVKLTFIQSTLGKQQPTKSSICWLHMMKQPFQFKQSAFSFMFYILKHPSWHFTAVLEIIRHSTYGQALIIAFKLCVMNSFPLCLEEKLTIFLKI